MPLGSALTTRIDIDFTRAQGDNSSGKIMFYPFRAPVGTTMISTDPVTVTLQNGVGSVELVRMGSSHYYAAREFIDGRPERSFRFYLPENSADVIRYRDLQPITLAPDEESGSILDTIKKMVGLPSADTSFDTDILIHINSAFTVLHQLGVGPTDGFRILSNEIFWSEFLSGQIPLDMVKTYVYLYVRLLFDPPGNSFAVKAIEDQKKELEWRINVQREEELWTPGMRP